MHLHLQMISSEVTVLFEKACQSESFALKPCEGRSLNPLSSSRSSHCLSLTLLHSTLPQLLSLSPVFIQELTARSHLVSLASRRRTLSRPDVAQAVSKSDMFDFLIDIIPRDDAASTGGATASGSATPAGGAGGGGKNGKGKKGKGKKRSRKSSVEDEDGNYGEEEGEETPLGSEFGAPIEGEYEAVGFEGGEEEHKSKRARMEGEEPPVMGDPNAIVYGSGVRLFLRFFYSSLLCRQLLTPPPSLKAP